MKALSLTQPWATLVAIGAKRIETRSWNTTYRGAVAIHAAKGFPRDCQEGCAEEPFRAVLKAAGFTNTNELPRGSIVAVARLFKTERTEAVTLDANDDEHAFGDYAPGRFAWFLQGVQKLPEPVECRGSLGLWTVPLDVEAMVRRQLGAVV